MTGRDSQGVEVRQVTLGCTEMDIDWASSFQLLPGLLLTQQLEEAQAMLERRNRRLTPVAWVSSVSCHSFST